MSYVIEYLVAFTAIIIIPIYYYYMKIRRIAKYCENYPSPPGKFFINNASDFKTTKDFLPTLHRYTKEYGSIVHVRIGPIQHNLVVSDPKFLEFALTSPKILERSANVKYMRPWLGNGLVTADGDAKWRMHRKLLTPAFHFKILEQFVDIFEASGNILIEKLSEVSGSQSVDIYPYISTYALDVICETAMGTKVDVQNNKTSEYFEAVKDMCRLFTVRTLHLLKRYDFFFQFTKDFEVQKKAIKVLHDYSNSVINRKREEFKKKQAEQEKKDNDLGIKERKVFLDLILNATLDGQSLSHEEIRAEVDTFMFAGHDTTATATSYILYCLANNKEAQDKAYEEQKQIFGDNFKDVTLTYANVQEMKYLENVVKEGLRLYSPAAIYGRDIVKDVEYEGKIIPQGIRILIFAHGVHMNPKYYPNPEKFDPSRWDSNEDRPTFAYIPFGAGSRNCIGQKYAMLEIKSTVSKILRNFELFPSIPEHKMILASEAVMKSLNGVRIGLKLRENLY